MKERDVIWFIASFVISFTLVFALYNLLDMGNLFAAPIAFGLTWLIFGLRGGGKD